MTSRVDPKLATAVLPDGPNAHLGRPKCANCGRPTWADTLDFNGGICDACAYDRVVAPSWNDGIDRIARRGVPRGDPR